MGLPVDDYERGEDNGCWPAGETPKYIYVNLEERHKDWNAVVTQTIDPERWDNGGIAPALHVRLDIGPFNNKLTVTKDWDNKFLAEALLCAQEFHDLVEDIWGYYFWDPHTAVGGMVGSGYLWSGPDTKYDVLYWGDNKWTFRLANKRVPSNILVSYQP